MYKGKENKKCRAIGFIVGFLFVVIIVTILIEHLIRTFVVPGLEETWASSTASYWGGIIGGVISGILTFLGVFYTIRYYKESDERKQIAAVQPFLFIDITSFAQDVYSPCFLLDEIVDDEESLQIYASIKNIGNGFAKTISIHTAYSKNGFTYSRVISPNGSAGICFIADKSIYSGEKEFSLQFVDSMTNKYTQGYVIRIVNDIMEIECGYPELV